MAATKKVVSKDITLYYINGEEIGEAGGSLNEWYFAKACDDFEIPYRWQVWVLAPAYTIGSQRIDFLLLRPPKPQPVQIYGEYWHGGLNEMETLWKEWLVNSRKSDEWLPVIGIKGEDTNTREKGRMALINEVGI